MKKGQKWTDEERAKRAAAHAEKKKAEIARKKLEVCYMDEDLQTACGKMDVLDRHELAEKLEKQAAQLRGFDQPRVKFVMEAKVKITPKMKAAAMAFAERFGCRIFEQDQIDCGIRWLLEAAIPRIETLEHDIERHIAYSKAEGFEESVLTEKKIGDALENWQKKIRRKAESASDDDDD